MSKLLDKEKKDRKQNIAKSSITIRKPSKPKKVLKGNKGNKMDSFENFDANSTLTKTDSPGADVDADLKTLILSIKRTQCTKQDMKLLTDSVNSKLVEIDSKVSAQDGKIDSMNQRLTKCEMQAASAQYHMELEKQRSLKNNLSIFGVGRSDGENLVQIVLSVFNKIGCVVAENQIVNCYRINGNNNNIIIAKLNDYELKQSQRNRSK